MKTHPYLGLCLILLSSLASANPARDLKKSPLTEREKMALKAAESYAKVLGDRISEKCVNAEFKAGSLPVTLQFVTKGDQGQIECVDSHYSIEVDFRDDGVIQSISLNDA